MKKEMMKWYKMQELKELDMMMEQELKEQLMENQEEK